MNTCVAIEIPDLSPSQRGTVGVLSEVHPSAGYVPLSPFSATTTTFCVLGYPGCTLPVWPDGRPITREAPSEDIPVRSTFSIRTSASDRSWALHIEDDTQKTITPISHLIRLQGWVSRTALTRSTLLVSCLPLALGTWLGCSGLRLPGSCAADL